MNGLLSWMAMGLIAGALAKFILPGKDPGGFIVTILLGIAGAVVGGWVGTQAGIETVHDFSLKSVGLATGGGILLLVVYRMLKKKGEG